MSQNRTKIRLKLTVEARAVLGTEWVALDLPADFSFRLSKNVEELSDVNEINTEAVLPFSVPFSRNNDLALLPFTSPVIVDNPLDGIEARAETDSYQLNYDRVYFIRKDDSTRQWDLEFRRSPDHWLELASNKQLCTIDCGTATLNATTVANSWNNPTWEAGEPVVTWCPQDYGGWVDLSEPIQFTDPPTKQVWLEDMRPNYSLLYLLVQGFCEIGWTLKGLVLETEWFRSLWIYILSREYFTQSKGGDFIIVGRDYSADVDMNTDPLLITSIDTDPGGNAIETNAGSGFYYPGISNNLPYKTCYRFIFQGIIENTSGTNWPLKTLLMEFDSDVPPNLTGVVLGEDLRTLNAGETAVVRIEMEASVEPGQRVYMNVGFQDNGILDLVGVTCKKGYYFQFEPCSKSLIRGDTVDLKRLISCEENYTLLNLFKGVCHLLNARLETDFDTRTLTIHPYRATDVYDNPTPGFIDDGTLIDVNGKIICDSAKIVPVKNTLTRFTRLQFSESTDAYITEVDPLEPPHSRKVLNGIDLVDKITELENPFFEPTLEGQSDVLRKAVVGTDIGGNPSTITLDTPFLPRLWDNTDGNRSFNIAPRIFFHYGLVSQVSPPQPTTLPAYFYFEGDPITEFGYLTQVRTWELAPTPAVHLDGSVVFGTLAKDLYVTFYLGYLLARRRGSLIDVLIWMDSTDYRNWNFRNPFIFDYGGLPVRGLVQSIRDFAPTTDLPTPVTMLVEPMMTECCDNPCGCRFRECDYFQDFGQYMSQATLDSLSITSFKVNQIEQLAAPVDFGIIKVIQVNGKPFVSNLVDALNSAGVDYFYFKPSDKNYTGKSDARFFKIKCPACWSFVIEISDGVEVIYRYTDALMEQTWFGAGFSPFGYGGNPVSEPQDCQITVEY